MLCHAKHKVNSNCANVAIKRDNTTGILNENNFNVT